MLTQARVHKFLSLVVALNLFLTLLPLPVWAALSLQAPANLAVTPVRAVNPAALLTDPDSAESLTALADRLPLAAAAVTNAEPAAPLSVGRAQSAYSADAAPQHTVVVTFTVRNTQNPLLTPVLDPNANLTDTLAAVQAVDYSRDPHTLRNVILTDTFLPPQATLLAASQPVDHAGNTTVWNLGDIPPLGQAVVTATLAIPASVLAFTDLDAGATGWGTLSGAAVSAQATPARLRPDGFAGWLICSIDANCQDRVVLDKAAELGGDPAAIFEFVQALGYDSYQGSLRGARGALWSAAGNSVDKASLLIALLRANGIPAAYRHGPLDEALRNELILSMFPPTNGLAAMCLMARYRDNRLKTTSCRPRRPIIGGYRLISLVWAGRISTPRSPGLTSATLWYPSRLQSNWPKCPTACAIKWLSNSRLKIITPLTSAKAVLA